MRYTVRGRLTPPVVREVLQQFAQHLSEHEVDELTSLSIYYTPYSAGRKVEFHSPDGQNIDQIIVEPVATRLYRGTGTPVQRQPYSTKPAPNAGLQGAAQAVAKILEKWRLSHQALAVLMYSHEVRIPRLLNLELPFIMKREKARLSILQAIDESFDALAQPVGIGEWLRSDATMATFEGECPLDQLLWGGEKALLRMRDALSALSELCWSGEDCPPIVSGFDEILEGKGQAG